MKSVKELANETVTSTTGVDTVQGSEWLKSILETAKQAMYFEQFAYVGTVKKGNKDVRLPITTSHIAFTSFSTQAVDRTMTVIDNMNTVNFEPVTAKLGARISQEVIDSTQVDMVRYAREDMAYHAAFLIDTSIATAIESASSPAATLFGGDATSTATLAALDVMTSALVRKARRYLKANGWFNDVKRRPIICIVPATAEEAFLAEAQFIDASKYGSGEIVMNGEIGKFLGVRVVVSEQCPSHADWGAGGDVAGHTCCMIKSQVSYGIAYRHKAKLDYEYDKNKSAFDIYLDMGYQSKTLQENSIVLIKVTDA